VEIFLSEGRTDAMRKKEKKKKKENEKISRTVGAGSQCNDCRYRDIQIKAGKMPC